MVHLALELLTPKIFWDPGVVVSEDGKFLGADATLREGGTERGSRVLRGVATTDASCDRVAALADHSSGNIVESKTGTSGVHGRLVTCPPWSAVVGFAVGTDALEDRLGVVGDDLGVAVHADVVAGVDTGLPHFTKNVFCGRRRSNNFLHLIDAVLVMKDCCCS